MTWAQFGLRLLEAFAAQSSVNDDVVHVALHTSPSVAPDSLDEMAMGSPGLPNRKPLAAPTNFSATLKAVERDEAKVLERLARETEVVGSPWAAAVNVFGASPPDVASVGL